MNITVKARTAGVMGWPVSHSLSPTIHGYWLEHHAIDGTYIPFPVHPDLFTDAVRGLKALGFAGCNVTAPHKQAALSAMDVVDPLAARVGAVNTIVINDQGQLCGYNSDVFGFMQNIHQTYPSWNPKAAPAVVVGAGGAARAVCVGLLEAGVPEIRLVNRTYEKAQELAAELGGPFTPLPWDQRHECLEGAGFLVNAGSMGMGSDPRVDIILDALPTTALVTDINYVPLMTDLLVRAQALGNPVVDGLGMLLHQAGLGFKMWFGVEPTVTERMRQHILIKVQQG